MINAYIRAGMPAQVIELIEVIISCSSASSSMMGVPQPASSTLTAVLARFFDSGDVEMGSVWCSKLMEQQHDPRNDLLAPSQLSEAVRHDAVARSVMVESLASHGIRMDRVITFAADMKRMQDFAFSNAEQKSKFLVDKVMHITGDVGKRSAIGPGGGTRDISRGFADPGTPRRVLGQALEATFRLLSSLAYPTLLEHQARASILADEYMPYVLHLYRPAPRAGAVPADMKPAEWTDLLNAAVEIDCHAPATTKIFARLVNTVEQITACEENYRRSSDGSFKLLHAPANRQGFRKSGVAQNALSIGRRYWSLAADVLHSYGLAWSSSSRREANRSKPLKSTGPAGSSFLLYRTLPLARVVSLIQYMEAAGLSLISVNSFNKGYIDRVLKVVFLEYDSKQTKATTVNLRLDFQVQITRLRASRIHSHLSVDGEWLITCFVTYCATDPYRPSPAQVLPPSCHHQNLPRLSCEIDEMLKSSRPRNRSLSILGIHLTSLINAYGCVVKDLAKVQSSFDYLSISPYAQAAYAVVYKAMIDARVGNKKADLIEGYMTKMKEQGARMIFLSRISDTHQLDQARETNII
ncbi:hypothetical protein M378DRAFT_12686 [Amanita muscaria Koide BX008]|uniref:Uncharacterized protein n=1 Tax=Amanita muscaria (strain Koide BX008) TaxID=946122 RepID=A0A0C2X0F3_AMAMK|nr:hypothetical protein M378DRAFT_12686 [Amanita muscaria Koide BX008]